MSDRSQKIGWLRRSEREYLLIGPDSLPCSVRGARGEPGPPVSHDLLLTVRHSVVLLTEGLEMRANLVKVGWIASPRFDNGLIRLDGFPQSP